MADRGWDQMIGGLAELRGAAADVAGEPTAAERIGRLYGELMAVRRKLDALEGAMDAANVTVDRAIRLLAAELEA